MRVIYKDAVQAHAVPKHILDARGPFGAWSPEKAEDTGAPVDPYPPGATAQNGMTEVVFYECNDCQAVVREDNLDSHECEE